MGTGGQSSKRSRKGTVQGVVEIVEGVPRTRAFYEQVRGAGQMTGREGLRTIDAKLTAAQKSAMERILGQYDDPRSRAGSNHLDPYGVPLRADTIWLDKRVPRGTLKVLERLGLVEVVGDNSIWQTIRVLAKPRGA